MANGKQIAHAAIDEKKEAFCALSDRIWELAELSLNEYESAKTYCALMRDLGFEVEENVSTLETAFLGKYGSGRPIIGVLGEFDALSGLSQVGGATEKAPLEKGGNGHGCGHNMLGAGALAAAYGLKEYLKETKKSGTVIFFGTPGEEGGAGKAFMAKKGVWKDLDAALTWHPGDCNEVATGTCNSCIQTLYKYHGVASHAAADPEKGRSALDAAELLNLGVQYLREHVGSDARIHYAMVDGGGLSPNVVQAEASVLYMVRSILAKDAAALQKRVDDVAAGAALMTGTTLEKIFIDACSNTVPNHTLEAALFAELKKTPLPVYSLEEKQYAQAVKATCENRLPGISPQFDKASAERVAMLSDNGTKPLNNFIVPLWTGDAFSAGSTDVGDVSWLTPTVQLYTACFVSGSPGHSWQNVSCGKTSIGHKGMLFAAKVLASFGVRLFEDEELLAAAKEEWKEATKGGYVCPIPENETIKPLTL